MPIYILRPLDQGYLTETCTTPGVNQDHLHLCLLMRRRLALPTCCLGPLSQTGVQDAREQCGKRQGSPALVFWRPEDPFLNHRAANWMPRTSFSVLSFSFLIYKIKTVLYIIVRKIKWDHGYCFSWKMDSFVCLFCFAFVFLQGLASLFPSANCRLSHGETVLCLKCLLNQDLEQCPCFFTCPLKLFFSVCFLREGL